MKQGCVRLAAQAHGADAGRTFLAGDRAGLWQAQITGEECSTLAPIVSLAHDNPAGHGVSSPRTKTPATDPRWRLHQTRS